MILVISCVVWKSISVGKSLPQLSALPEPIPNHSSWQLSVTWLTHPPTRESAVILWRAALFLYLHNPRNHPHPVTHIHCNWSISLIPLSDRMSQVSYHIGLLFTTNTPHCETPALLDDDWGILSPFVFMSDVFMVH